jgi:ketopantoate reductase
MMALSDAMGAYKTSTMLDLVNKRPMEVKYVFRKFVNRADELDISVPTLETLVTQIEFLQRDNDLF